MSRGENLPYSKHSEEIYSSVQFTTAQLELRAECIHAKIPLHHHRYGYHLNYNADSRQNGVCKQNGSK